MTIDQRQPTSRSVPDAGSDKEVWLVRTAPAAGAGHGKFPRCALPTGKLTGGRALAGPTAPGTEGYRRQSPAHVLGKTFPGRRCVGHTSAQPDPEARRRGQEQKCYHGLVTYCG